MIKYVNSHVSDTSKQMKHIKTNVNILMDTLRHHDLIVMIHLSTLYQWEINHMS